MPRPKTGSAVALWKQRNGKRIKVWYACVDYYKDGKRRFERRRPKENTKTAAKELAQQMLHEFKEQGPESFDSAHITFAQLASHFEQSYLVEPEYIDGRKVAGLRNKYDFEKRLTVLRNFFRNQKIRSITYGDLKRYKATRLKTPIVVGRNTRGTDKPGNPTTRQRSMATVNRELSLLRRIFNVAVENGWLLKNPFSTGKSLINPGDEKPRERVLTKVEEERLLAACDGPRAHLRPIIIMALDTGMRRGEMLKLRWSDIDFENRIITTQALNTKTIREREGGMSARLCKELVAMWEQSNKDRNDLVFGIMTSPKKAFNKAIEIAGITDLRFHDLRHTHGTRLASKGLPISEIGRSLGHTQINTTYRYLNINRETIRKVVNLIDEINEPADSSEETLIN